MKIIERKISELKPAEYNPRQLTEKQYRDIKNSLEKFGFVDPVIVNKHDNRKDIIVGGHQRIKVWQDLGHKTVPTVEVCLAFPEEQELNVRLNKNTGGWDFDILANYFDKDDLVQWGFQDFELGLGGANDDLDDSQDTSTKTSSKEDGENGDPNYIIQYNIVFNDEAEQKTWFDFLAQLKKDYADLETISERLCSYITDHA